MLQAEIRYDDPEIDIELVERRTQTWVPKGLGIIATKSGYRPRSESEAENWLRQDDAYLVKKGDEL